MSDPDSLDFPEMGSYYPVTGEVLEDPMSQDATTWDMSGENVEVDQTPLQEQIQKNKECEYIAFASLSLPDIYLQMSCICLNNSPLHLYQCFKNSLCF